MNVVILKEYLIGENRVAAIPATIKEMVKKDKTVLVESGAGTGSFISDEKYIAAGAKIIPDRPKLLDRADLILKVTAATVEEIVAFKSGSAYVSFFQTTTQLHQVKKLQEKNITAFSMHLLPRTTLAQSMDALSSQSNIAGYRAVLIGATHLRVYMPLLMTAAGTIPPAKVLVLGAGVAGLHAIATAKRLGGQVEAFDVRPDVQEQVTSLGAKFIKVETDADEGIGAGGYAKETSADYKQRQQQLIREHIAKSDLVVTTALIPGKKAPILIPESMVNEMKPGAVIMDLAAENGGNCECTEPGKVITHQKVIVDGTLNLAGSMSIHASQLYAKNIISFVQHLCPKGKLNLNLDDEIISSALFTHNGEITHGATREALQNL